MVRTFHSKVDWWYWLLMLVTAFLLFDFFWFHETLLTLLLAVIMIFEIEMLIHTQYIITDESILRIETGRFIPNSYVDLSQIQCVRKVRCLSIAPALSIHRLEIEYMKKEAKAIVQISPKNERDFIQWIHKKNDLIKIEFYGKDI